ncbi:cupin-like domain-containing protein [Flavobacteriaceae bacterium F89]|uniref:Cupin-like domain-containing protein n=1 Tax=Cerina litoralis TaxID=2874477 RepID=A0AAE3EV00_9FLAO|nr:cupin-like domain-containing protein [Cerina litoralis]MCG2460162.1 cupin-like domain-containing protein [Cerina litoralis]
MAQIKTTPITRIKDISKKDFIQNFYKPQRPVLLDGLTKDWGAYGKWNLDYIQQRAGDQVVPLYNSEPTKGKQNSAAPVQHMKLYDYIDLLKTAPTDLRIFFYNILDHMPELIKDFKYPDIGLKFFKRLPAMFFGGKGSKVLLHYDMDLADAIHFHFHGNKSVTLFAPDQTKYLYKVPFAVHNLETINLESPDFKKYPALQHVTGVQVHMKHGDALYMPSGYWHYIKYLDSGFSLTLRAFPRKPQKVATMLYNVFIMRHFENSMRKMFGQKWVDYKDNLVVRKTNNAKNLSKARIEKQEPRNKTDSDLL